MFIEDYISQFRDDNKNYETIFSNIYIKSKIKYLQSTFLKSYEKQLNCSNLEINFKNLDQFIKLMINELDDPKILIVEKYFGDDQLTVATLLPQAGAKPAFRKPASGARHMEGTR